MKQLIGVILLLVTLFGVGCQQDKPAYTHLEGQAQGTTFSIIYQDSLQRDYAAPIDSLFRLIDKSMSLWDSTSIITRMNQNDTSIRADKHLQRVFDVSEAVSASTGGAFDITVGPLVRTWGFSYKKNLPFPDSAVVDSLKSLIGYQKVHLDKGRLVKADPRMEIDLNAIAQGYTVDVMAEFLEARGVHNYMIEIGGELRTAGVNEQHEPWLIGIDKPIEGEGRALQAILKLSGKSLATSGSYRKFIERDGHKFSHAINPQTGFPVEHPVLSVSVIADNCTLADAYATACLVQGLEWSFELAREKKLEVFCIYADDNNKMQTQATPGFEQLMQDPEKQ